jgi:hypothetical protein
MLSCVFGSGAFAQETGSVLGQSLTFTASGTATMNFAVNAPQGTGAVTVLTLEFGPEGNNSIGDADQPIPLMFTLSTTINGQPAMQQFGASGGVDLQRFPGKIVVLSHNPPNVPGYQLIVTHTAGVVAQENWTLRVDGLPVSGVRGIAMINPTSVGTFSSLTPSVSCAAPPGPLGTLLRRTLTFTGTSVATAAFSAGQQDPNSTTSAWLEFGGEGSGTPAGFPMPASATINVTATFAGNTASHMFSPNGESDVQFGSNLKVSLLPPQPSAPGLYVLNIVRGTNVPAPDESWTLQIAGLFLGMRGTITVPTRNVSVGNAIFQSLSPIGACPAPQIQPAIAVSPSQITAGDSPRVLTVTSSGGFDLSHLTTAHVSLSDTNGISNFTVSDTTSTSLLVTFDIDKCARRGQRAVVINAHTLTVSAPFSVVHAPGQDTISVSDVSITSPGTGTSQNTVQIIGSSCVDLTGVSSSDIAITPPDAILNVSAITRSGPNTFQFTFSFNNCAAPSPRTLTIQQLSTSFTPKVSPPSINTSGKFIQGLHATMDILAATGCVDLSQVGLGQITMNPSTGIGPVTMVARSASELTLGFDLALDAPSGSRTLSVVDGNNNNLSAPFVVSACTISVSDAGKFIQGRHATMDILAATGCVDLSQVGLGQITMNPSTGIGPITMVARSAGELTLGFDLAADAPSGSRTLSVVAGSSTLSAPFVVSAFRVCTGNLQCCQFDPDIGCLSCRPTRPPICPVGQMCCDDDPCANRCTHCARLCP